MKAKKVNEPKDTSIFLSDDNYIAELKYDGQRRFLQWKDGEVKIFNKQMIERTCPQELKDEVLLKFSSEKTGIFKEFILDGELVYIDRANNTHHRTQAQNPNAELTYMVFDIINIGGEKCVDKTKEFIWTWEHRRAELEGVCNFATWHPEADGVIQLVYFVSSTEFKKKLLKFAKDQSLEGIILKNKQATYESNVKSDMIKIKFTMTDDYIVVGYTDATEKSINRKGVEIDNKRYPYFRALVLAQFNKKDVLKPKAQIGGGFNNIELIQITSLLHKEFKRKTDAEISVNWTGVIQTNIKNDKSYRKTYGTINWLIPSEFFVIEIEMMNKTEYGNPFQGRFLTLRDDKLPNDCKEE